MKPLDSMLDSDGLHAQRSVADALHVLHSLRTACPIAVMELQLLALQDECANTILSSVSSYSQSPADIRPEVLTWPLATALKAFTVIVAEFGEQRLVEIRVD